MARTPLSVTTAFQTILRNRINRGGILAPGAGRIKNGESGKGKKSRWYPDTLRRMTYDNAASVKGMADRHGFTTACVSMKNTHNAEMTELIISRDLGWLLG